MISRVPLSVCKLLQSFVVVISVEQERPLSDCKSLHVVGRLSIVSQEFYSLKFFINLLTLVFSLENAALS